MIEADNRSTSEQEHFNLENMRLPGIVGGLGPKAHLDFEMAILHAGIRRGASSDQQHLPYALFSLPITPDRTAHIGGQGSDPTAFLKLAAGRLEKLGCAAVVMTCNTAHKYWDAVQEVIDIPLFHLIRVTTASMLGMDGISTGSKIGVLATTGTLQSGLYDEALCASGFETIALDLFDKRESSVQQMVMDAIYHEDYGVKSKGEPTDTALKNVLWAVQSLIEKGAGCLIAGCTELPMLLRLLDSEVPWVDPLEVMAETLWDFHRGEGRFCDLQNSQASFTKEDIVKMSENFAPDIG